MSVFRTHKNKNYTVMSNYHLRDKSLSWSAKGMLSFFLSNDDEFEYSIQGIVGCAKDGDCSVKSTMKELKEKGYLKVYAIRDSKGHIADWQYDIYENPYDENPEVENPLVESSIQRNTNIKENTNSNNIIVQTSIFELEPIKQEEIHTMVRKQIENGVLVDKIIPITFERFWLDYNKKVGKAESERLWNKLTEQDHIDILSKVLAYVASTPDSQYRMNPTTYLNQKNKRWNDDVTYRGNGNSVSQKGNAILSTDIGAINSGSQAFSDYFNS